MVDVELKSNKKKKSMVEMKQEIIQQKQKAIKEANKKLKEIEKKEIELKLNPILKFLRKNINKLDESSIEELLEINKKFFEIK